MLRVISIILLLGSTAMAANEKRMKQLAKVSGVPLSRILKFQKRESANGKYLTGDRGQSGGDLHLYKSTAILIAKKLGDDKLIKKLKSLSTEQESGKYSFSPYSKYLVDNLIVQDKMLVWLLRQTKKATDKFVKKTHGREAEDYEHYAFWNSSPKAAKKAIKANFKSDDKDIQVLLKNIEGFKKQTGSYLKDKPTVKIKESVKIKEGELLIPKDKSKIAGWMRKHGLNQSDMKKSDGSWYHPGEIIKSEKEEEWEVDPAFEEDVVRDPHYGTEVDMPEPDISPELMPLDQPTPFGIYARGEPEFEMAEEEQEEVMMAADGGEVEIPSEIASSPYGKDWRKRRPITEEEKAEVQQLLASYSPEAIKGIKRRLTRGGESPSVMFGEMIAELREEKEGKARGYRTAAPRVRKYAEGEELEEEHKEQYVYKPRKKWTQDPRRKMVGEAKTAAIRQAGEFGEATEGYNPFMFDPSVVEGEHKSLTESEGRDVRKKGRGIRRITPTKPRFKQRRDKKGKLTKEIIYEQDRPWWEGGELPSSRKIQTLGKEGEKFRTKDYIPQFESPFEEAEREAMMHGRQSPEFKSKLWEGGRGFEKKFGKEAAPGLASMAGKDTSEDWGKRYFMEALGKADPAERKKLMQANPELAAEVDNFQEGGEVIDEYEDIAEFRAAEGRSMETEEFPSYLQRPPEIQEEESFSIEDIVAKMDKASEGAGDKELQKASEVIEEDVSEVKEEDISAEPEVQRRQRQLESMSDRSLMEYETDEFGRRPSEINKEIRRRKWATRKEAGLTRKTKKGKVVPRSPSLKEMVKVEDKIIEPPESIKKDVKQTPDTEPKVQVIGEVEKRMEVIKRHRDELDAKIAEYQDKELKYSKIDNERFFNRGGTLNKIISLIAAGFGGYASGRYGGPNVYLNLIDKEVKRDIEQQKLDRSDEVAKQNAAYKKIQQLADRYKRSVTDDVAYKKLDILSQKMDEKIKAGRTKLAKEEIQKNESHEVSRPMTGDRLQELSFKYPKMKLNERALTAKNGMKYIVDSASSRKSLEEKISNNQSALMALDQLKSVVPRLAWYQRLPTAGRWSVDRKLADSTRDALIGKLRLELFGPGVMTDTEREQAKKIIGDPASLLELDKVKIAALDNIAWKLRYAERQDLRRNGINLPESRNEINIRNRLANRGIKKPSSNQIREAMDQLIELERKALIKFEKTGKRPGDWYPGKYWNKDEPSAF